MTSLDHQAKQSTIGQHCQFNRKQGFFYRHFWRYLVAGMGSLLIVIGCQLRNSVGSAAPLHALLDSCRATDETSYKKNSETHF